MSAAQSSRTRRQSGMTLIEVMIAIMLLAVGVAGMISIQVLAMRDEAIARQDNEASRIARDVLEQVARMPFASVLPTADYDQPAWIANAGYADGQVPVSVQTPVFGPKLLVLEPGLLQLARFLARRPSSPDPFVQAVRRYPGPATSATG